MNYPFKHNENRSILVFCKLRNQLDAAIEAGATLAGGIDIITAIKVYNLIYVLTFNFFIF